MKFYQLLILICLTGIAASSCKKNAKKKVEELPTEVASFDPEKYKTSALDSADFAAMKRFGSVYDSSVYTRDLDSIALFFEGKKFEDIFFTNSGAVYAVKKYGKGIYPLPGDKMHVYTETQRWDGKVVFSSAQYKQPLEFILGTGQVVPAWDEILPNLPAGTEALIVAPSAMSYGKKTIPKALPGNSILIYDIKIDKVFPADATANQTSNPMFKVEQEEKEKDKDSKVPSLLRKPSGIPK